MRGKAGLVLSLALGLGFLALLAVSFRGQVLRKPAFPPHLGGLELTHQVSGPEAIRDIERLHGVRMDMADASIFHYSAGGERVQVWVARAPSEKGAEDLLQRMTLGMEGGDSPFTPPRPQIMDGQEVFFSQGQGAYHYYYRKGDRVIWVQIEARDPQLLLQEALRIF